MGQLESDPKWASQELGHRALQAATGIDLGQGWGRRPPPRGPRNMVVELGVLVIVEYGWTLTLEVRKLESGFRVICAGVPSDFCCIVGSEEGRIPIIWL